MTIKTREDAPLAPTLPLAFRMFDHIENLIQSYNLGLMTVGQLEDELKAESLHLITQAATDTSALLMDYFVGPAR